MSRDTILAEIGRFFPEDNSEQSLRALSEVYGQIYRLTKAIHDPYNTKGKVTKGAVYFIATLTALTIAILLDNGRKASEGAQASRYETAAIFLTAIASGALGMSLWQAAKILKSEYCCPQYALAPRDVTSLLKIKELYGELERFYEVIFPQPLPASPSVELIVMNPSASSAPSEQKNALTEADIALSNPVGSGPTVIPAAESVDVREQKTEAASLAWLSRESTKEVRDAVTTELRTSLRKLLQSGNSLARLQREQNLISAEALKGFIQGQKEKIADIISQRDIPVTPFLFGGEPLPPASASVVPTLD